MRVLRVEIDPNLLFPFPVRGDINVIIVRIGLASAMTPIPHANIVANLRRAPIGHDAILRNPGRIHRSIAVGIRTFAPQCVELCPFGIGHDDPIDWLEARVRFVVDLIKQVCRA